MTALPLVFDVPKRGLPPRHLVDMSPVGWRDAVVGMKERPFRAAQLAHHYFARPEVDPAQMTASRPSAGSGSSPS